MTSAIAQYLPDFGLGVSCGKELPIPPKRVQVQPEEAVEDTASLIQAAEERVRTEERASAQRELEIAIASEKAKADQRVAEERLKWVREEAAALASQLKAALEALEVKLADKVASIMTPFLVDTLHRQAIDEFKIMLSSLVAEGQGAAIRICGPEDILSALVTELETSKIAIEYRVNDEPDVSAKINDTVIETQLQKWIGRLAEVARE